MIATSYLSPDLWRLIAADPTLRVRDILRLCQVCKETHNAIWDSEIFWITFRKTRYPSLPAYTNPCRIRYRCQELEFDLIEDAVTTANRDALIHIPHTYEQYIVAEFCRKLYIMPRNLRQLLATAHNAEILRILTSLINNRLCDFLLLWLFSSLSLKSREQWLLSHIIDPSLLYDRRCQVINVCFQPLLLTPEIIEKSIDLLYRSDFINRRSGFINLFAPYMNSRQTHSFLRHYIMSDDLTQIECIAPYVSLETIRDELRDIELLISYMTYGNNQDIHDVQHILTLEVARRNHIPDSTEDDRSEGRRQCDHLGACICDLPQEGA